jgi:hypothetical protein
MSIPALVAKRLIPVAMSHESAEAMAAAMAAPTGHKVGVRHESQLGTFWCWAAVATAMRAFVRSDLPAMSQCDVAKLHLGHSQSCCVNGRANGDCDMTQPPERALATVGVKVKPATGTLPAHQVKAELTATPKNRPICLLIRFEKRPDHVVQLDGFRDTGTLVYQINDPERGPVEVSETELLTNYRDEKGQWFRTYLLES